MTTAGPGFLGRFILHDLGETIIPRKLRLWNFSSQTLKLLQFLTNQFIYFSS
jgi:hypothetical protein